MSRHENNEPCRRYQRFLEGQKREDCGDYLGASFAYQAAGATNAVACMHELVAAQLLAQYRPPVPFTDRSSNPNRPDGN